MKAGGYYEREVEPGLVVISINTIPYSYHHTPPSSQEDPFGQFEWLESRLASAASLKQSVIIVGHIGPIVDSYAKKDLWAEQHVKSYMSLVRRFKHVIRLQLFGHLHSNEFRAFPQPDDLDMPPLLMSGSITPLFGNHPGFRVFNYDTTSLSLKNFVSYSYSQGDWQVSDSTKLGLANLTNAGLLSFAHAMAKSNATFASFMDSIYAGGKYGKDYTQEEWSCLEASVTRAEFNTCMGSPAHQRIALLTLVAPVVVVIALLVALVGYLVRRRIRHRSYNGMTIQYSALATDLEGPELVLEQEQQYSVPDDYEIE